ncbi:MAG TPA: hypothetical protein PKY10_15205 [Lentisphaeria bacterium]|nr:hypothetical protein [Lentisphaeria bacterium]
MSVKVILFLPELGTTERLARCNSNYNDERVKNKHSCWYVLRFQRGRGHGGRRGQRPSLLFTIYHLSIGQTAFEHIYFLTFLLSRMSTIYQPRQHKGTPNEPATSQEIETGSSQTLY